VKHLYPENYKIVIREIEEDTNKLKAISNIVKMSIFPQVIYRFFIISIKISTAFFFFFRLFFCVILGFELSFLHWLRRCSTT
jgi:hypothetical protein